MKNILIKFLIITGAVFLSIFLTSPAALIAEDEPSCGLNIEDGTLHLSSLNSDGLTWQFDIQKDDVLLVSKTGTVKYNANKEGYDYWLDTYTLFELYQKYSEGNFTATLQIMNGTNVIDGPHTLNFDIFKPEGAILDIVAGSSGEDTTFKLFAKIIMLLAQSKVFS